MTEPLSDAETDFGEDLLSQNVNMVSERVLPPRKRSIDECSEDAASSELKKIRK